MIKNNQDMMKKVISVYSKQKIWSKTAKKVFRGIGFGLFSEEILSVKWETIFKEWIKELRSLPPPALYIDTGETSTEFISRFICKLYMKGFINQEEKKLQLETLLSENKILKPENVDAQILFLKAFFEISRMDHIFGDLSKIRFSTDIRTLDELISYPFEVPLPGGEGEIHPIVGVRIPKGYGNLSVSNTYNEILLKTRNSQEAYFEWKKGFEKNNVFIENLLKARLEWMSPDVAEFHLVYNRSRDPKYHQAILKMVLNYPSLSVAYEKVKQKIEKTDIEMIFITDFRQVFMFRN